MWAQILCGFLLLELGVYAWHRTMHNTPFLWRWFHQMHHSAERVDIWGAFYFHPFDMLGWALVGSLVLVLGFGITAEAAIAVNVAATFCSMFQHANIRTPRWLGYLITSGRKAIRSTTSATSTPATMATCRCSTCSSARSTIRAAFEGEVGFYEGGSKRLGAMLAGRLIA